MNQRMALPIKPESTDDSAEHHRSTVFQRIRLKFFAALLATTLAVIGAVSWAALPLWPVVGVAVATIALVFNGMTSRLNEPVCWTCGEDLSRMQSGEYGSICPGCGALNSTPNSDDDGMQPPASV